MRVFNSIRGIRHRPRDVVKALLILGVAGPVLVTGSALASFFVFPIPATVPDPTPGSQAQTSHVYASDGSLIATFHSEHNRELIKLAQVPVHLQQAAIASEDARFYKHRGFDPKAIGRALIADLKARDVVQGGSTITQQYVKTAFIEKPRRTIFRKVREVLIATQIEQTYSKRKILENYLNTVYFGKGAYGVQAAAKTFFGKEASQVSLSEAALMIGVIPAPQRFSPYEHPESAEIRRSYVLNRMHQLDMIDRQVRDAAKAEKPALRPPQQQVFKFPWFVDALYRNLKNDPKYGDARIFAGGLQIYTTIDPMMQEAAESALKETLDRPKDPGASLVAIDPKTGYVKAVANSRDFSPEQKFNWAVQARRQPGSAFKPFVLVAALERGIKPTTTYSGPGSMCPKGWPKGKNDCPVENYGRSGYGRITVEKATINSVNTVYAQMTVAVTPKRVVEVAQRMGVKTKVNPVHAVGLGSGNVTPLEMASAYATLAANGIFREPKFVTKVLDSRGTVIEAGPSEPKEVIDPAVAATTSKILSKVITSGTGKKAKIDRPAAGKTGTATENRNAWFVGYTPDLAAAVWMGYPENEKQKMRNVQGVREVTGGTLPASIWADFMKIALREIPPSEFPEPGEIRVREEGAGGEGFRLPPRSGPRASPTAEPSVIAEPSEEPSPSPTPTEEPTTRPSVLPSVVPT